MRREIAAGLATILLASAPNAQELRIVDPRTSVKYNGNDYNGRLLAPPEFDRDHAFAFILEAQNPNVVPPAIEVVKDGKGNFVFGRIVTRKETIDSKTNALYGCEWGDIRYDPRTAEIYVALQQISGLTTERHMGPCQPQQVSSVMPALELAYRGLQEGLKR